MRIRNKTGLLVAGLGTLVTGAGFLMRRRRYRTGVAGFGLAHVLLGVLDMFRPTVRE